MVSFVSDANEHNSPELFWSAASVGQAFRIAPWKVAVSGLHRPARFQVVGPFQARPVFLDDTCNYLPFEEEISARLVADVLNSHPCQQFLQSLIFTGSKRPITVELLQRLNLNAIADKAGYGQRWRTLQRVHYKPASEPPQFELAMEGAKTLKMLQLAIGANIGDQILSRQTDATSRFRCGE